MRGNVMTDSPRVISWFKDSSNLLEIQIQIGKKIYIYSVPNSREIQGVERRYQKGHFGFKELNVIKCLGRVTERKIIR